MLFLSGWTWTGWRRAIPPILNQRFYGFDKLYFFNNNEDASGIREKVAEDLFREAGVPVPYSGFTFVHLVVGSDVAAPALYSIAEIPDKPLLKRYYTTDDGNLYKPTSSLETFSQSDFEDDGISDYSDRDDLDSFSEWVWPDGRCRTDGGRRCGSDDGRCWTDGRRRNPWSGHFAGRGQRFGERFGAMAAYCRFVGRFCLLQCVCGYHAGANRLGTTHRCKLQQQGDRLRKSRCRVHKRFTVVRHGVENCGAACLDSQPNHHLPLMHRPAPVQRTH